MGKKKGEKWAIQWIFPAFGSTSLTVLNYGIPILLSVETTSDMKIRKDIKEKRKSSKSFADS